MKLCNQISDPNECVIFFFKDRVVKPIFMHLLLKRKVFPENMGIGLDKKTNLIFFLILGGPYGPPQPGVRPKIGKFVNFRPLLHSQ